MATSHLPHEEQALLRSLRDDLPALRARVRALRSQGWTLRAIGEPLQARRSTVRSWELHPEPSQVSSNHPLPSPPNLRPAPSPALASPHSHAHTSIRALRPDVPSHDQDRIARLAPLARKVRGGTPPGSPYRAAKEELDDVLLSYLHRGVSVQRLADVAGVSYRAMKVRLDAAHASAPLKAVP